MEFQNNRRKRYQKNFSGSQYQRRDVQNNNGKTPQSDINDESKHDMFEATEKGIAREISENQVNLQSKPHENTQPTKLFVCNLHYNVLESELFELFSDFGRLLKVSIHFDKSGRSLGVANIFYEQRSNAIMAMEQYNGVLLDGKPLEIHIV